VVGVLGWLRALKPAPVHASLRERLYGSVGALIGLLCTEWVGRQALGGFNPWFIAPMGASAVLLFAAPASPLAQPWSIVGGNIVSAIVGVMCFKFLPAGMAPAIAVAVAIGMMFALRCLHPPGGAVALTAVLGGPAVTNLGFGFVASPVAFNSVVLVLVAILFNGLLGRNYLRRHEPPANVHLTRDPPPSARVGVQAEDVRQVLDEEGEFLDIADDDLVHIAEAAERHASERRFAEIRCGDIMSRDVVCVGEHEPLEQAWRLLGRHRLQALPVLDAKGALAGVISLRDVITHQGGRDTAVQWRDLQVAQCMTREVVTVLAATPLTSLIRPLSDGGLHQVPVLDDERCVIGTVTQSDLVAVLYGVVAAPVAGVAPGGPIA
jgi:CBS domain-containing membrane protein